MSDTGRLLLGGFSMLSALLFMGGISIAIISFTTMEAIEAGGAVSQAVNVRRYSDAVTGFRLSGIAAAVGFTGMITMGFAYVGQVLHDLKNSS